MKGFTDEQIEAIIDSHFRGKYEDPHGALAEKLDIHRKDAKTLFYRYVRKDKWLNQVVVKPHLELWLAVQKLYRAKGRYHTQLATEELFKQAGFVKQEPADIEDYNKGN